MYIEKVVSPREYKEEDIFSQEYMDEIFDILASYNINKLFYWYVDPGYYPTGNCLYSFNDDTNWYYCDWFDWHFKEVLEKNNDYLKDQKKGIKKFESLNNLRCNFKRNYNWDLIKNLIKHAKIYERKNKI